MRRKVRARIGMTLFFSLLVLLLLLITSFIVATLGFVLINAGVTFGTNNHLVQILIVLLACVIVGTCISPVIARSALKTNHKIIAAINQLAGGDFSVRLHIEFPPEFQRLSDSFNRMAEELGGLELLRSDFVNNFSHEFKTPIVSIKGFAEVLKYGDLTPEERDEYLDIVISESGRLASLATNVLNLSKVENQTILSERAAFNLGESVRRCLLLLETKWERKNIRLSAEIQDIHCYGNEELLSQVWLNLFDNALKFSPEGGAVSVTLEQEKEAAIFTLRDDGPGIDADAIGHIFEKFYQADISHATAGNGLGLTLAQTIIHLHGGTIDCVSLPGEGAKFTVSLPLK